jgi:putative CocE/NonD family hydrolase
VAARVKSDFARKVREVENTWIPMSDGCRLAARIWLPEDAEDDPVPAILEYIPYRKSDHTAWGDALRHPYFAGHGYASIRVDMRGSGDSDGILLDEYLLQEQDDGIEVIQWIASQPWCTGAVGQIGISWGGFNGLQIAARRPPALKAIISLMSTDDRYADDVHYMGGCLLADDGQFSWGSTMMAYNARPPDPAIVGSGWRDTWLERLDRTPPFVFAWFSHQRRDGFWKHGSVCENYDDIACPVYMIGGWADGYRDAVLRFLAGYSGPRKGLIGPWGHTYPEGGDPGPAIGFLQECLRWWDHWLKGEDTGIMNEPMLRAWMQDAVEPRPQYDERPGRWVAEDSWPSPRIATRLVALNPGSLGDVAEEESALSVLGIQHAGRDAGDWCSFGREADEPVDQRIEDGLSLTFTSAPLDEPIEILGVPKVVMTLASDRPIALVAVRLCDVSPQGSSLLVTRGLFNLTHRDGHEEPRALEPGVRYSVEVPLHSIAHSFPAGHRIRVAISPTYWPWAWPSPQPVTLTLFSGGESRLELPVRRPDPLDQTLRPFEPPETAPPPRVTILRPPREGRVLSHEVAAGRYRLDVIVEDGAEAFEASGTIYDISVRDAYSIRDGRPLSAFVKAERTISFEREGWRTRIETVSTLSSDNETFHLTNQLDAYEEDVRIFAKTSTLSVARDLV